jgi:3-deoxy-D-manno-octulosonic-acid transferase
LALRPLVQRLRQRLAVPLVVTTTTATGQQVARQSLYLADGIYYFPFDLAGPVRRALDRVRPRLVLLTESELWPTFLSECRRRSIPVVLINGRMSRRTLRRYRLVRGAALEMIGALELMLMQQRSHADHLIELGAAAQRVRTTGNLKFDFIDDAVQGQSAQAFVTELEEQGRFNLVAGSTVAGEEELLLEAFRALRAAQPNARLVLAPRHPERFAGVAQLLQRSELAWQRRSTVPLDPASDVVLLDTLGELRSIYRAAAIAVIGGSFRAHGGHNLLEPAACARPIVWGPHMENFAEIADTFLSRGGGLQVVAAELGETLIQLARDPVLAKTMGNNARSVIEESRGATERTLSALEPWLANLGRPPAVSVGASASR